MLVYVRVCCFFICIRWLVSPVLDESTFLTVGLLLRSAFGVGFVIDSSFGEVLLDQHVFLLVFFVCLLLVLLFVLIVLLVVLLFVLLVVHHHISLKSPYHLIPL